MVAASTALSAAGHGAAWPCQPLNSRGSSSPSGVPLAKPSGEFNCKLPVMPTAMKPPALMANSLRQLDSSPTATPSALWPPTPSPSSAMNARRMTELAFRMAGPMAATPEECQAPATVFAPMTSSLNANAGVFVPCGHPFGQAMVQMPQYFQPPPAPPMEPAPFPSQLAGYALQMSSMAPQVTQQASLGAATATAPAQPLQLAAAAPTTTHPSTLNLAQASEASSAPAVPQATSSPASVGSALHGSGECRPCAWFYKPKGCHMGEECGFCHICPEGELKNRKKAKVAAIRQSLGRAAQ